MVSSNQVYILRVLYLQCFETPVSEIVIELENAFFFFNPNNSKGTKRSFAVAFGQLGTYLESEEQSNGF